MTVYFNFNAAIFWFRYRYISQCSILTDSTMILLAVSWKCIVDTSRALNTLLMRSSCCEVSSRRYREILFCIPLYDALTMYSYSQLKAMVAFVNSLSWYFSNSILFYSTFQKEKAGMRKIIYVCVVLPQLQEFTAFLIR